MITSKSATNEEPYKKVAKAALEKAKHRRNGKSTKGYRDNKQFTSPLEMTALIGAGGKMLSLNCDEKNPRSYFHEVSYKSHKFIAITNKPYAPVIVASLR